MQPDTYNMTAEPRFWNAEYRRRDLMVRCPECVFRFPAAEQGESECPCCGLVAENLPPVAKRKHR